VIRSNGSLILIFPSYSTITICYTKRLKKIGVKNAKIHIWRLDLQLFLLESYTFLSIRHDCDSEHSTFLSAHKLHPWMIHFHLQNFVRFGNDFIQFNTYFYIIYLVAPNIYQIFTTNLNYIKNFPLVHRSIDL
jgi:hypothetical protein